MSQPQFKVILSTFAFLLISLSSPGVKAQSTYIVSSQPVSTPSQLSSGSTKLSVDFGMIGNSYSNGIDQSVGTGFGVDLRLKHELASELQFVADAGFQMNSGYSQIVYVDNSNHAQTLILNEASLNWAPARAVLLSFGTLNQSFLDDPMFMGSVAFPAAKQTAKFASGDFYVRLTTEEAIPTSSTTTPVTTQTDGLPSFLLGRVKLGFSDSHSYSVDAWGSYFQFGNLPGQVANESRLQGNTVTGLGVQGAQFAYEFAGLESGAAVYYHIPDTRVAPVLRTNFVYNTQAPDGQNQAFTGGAGLEIRPSYTIKITPRFEFFSVDSDACPAFYNVAWYGHDNSQGTSAVLNFELQKSKLNLEARYSSGTLITASPFQSNFSLFYLTASKSYDFL